MMYVKKDPPLHDKFCDQNIRTLVFRRPSGLPHKGCDDPNLCAAHKSGISNNVCMLDYEPQLMIVESRKEPRLVLFVMKQL